MALTLNENSKVVEINSLECFEKLKNKKESHLIDIRAQPEWDFVGVPDLSSINKHTFFITWQSYPNMKFNEDFETEIIRSNIKKDDSIFLICRSGQRSLKAAQYLNQLGYKNCFNVLDGFEGDKDLNNHRSTLSGWKLNRLPWKQ